MTSIGIFEAKTQFSSLVERVEGGEEVTITRHGRPVVRMISVRKQTVEQARKAVEDLLDLRKGATLGGLDWKELRDEGRK